MEDCREDCRFFLKPDVTNKESLLSETGEIKIREALEALKENKIKEFDNVDDLIKELNS